MPGADAIVGEAQITIGVIDWRLDHRRAQGKAIVAMARIIVIVVVVVGTWGTSLAKVFAVIPPVIAVPMDGAALIAGLQIFEDEALDPCVVLLVVVFDAPESIHAIELGDTGTILEEIFEDETHTLLFAVGASPLVIESETLVAQMTAVEEDLVARGGVAVASGDEESLEEVLQMWAEGLCFPCETAIVGFAAEIGGMVETYVKDDGFVGVGAKMEFLLMKPYVGGEE